MLILFERFIYNSDRDTEEAFLNQLEIDKISNTVIIKFEQDSKKRHVFDDYSDSDLLTIFYVYTSIGKKEDLEKMLEFELNHNNRFALKLVKIFTPTIYSSHEPFQFKSGFNEKQYQDMSKVINPQLIYEKLTRSFGILNPETGVNFGDRDVLSELQLVELFQKEHRSVSEKKDALPTQ